MNKLQELSNLTSKQFDHYYHKWLYTYGGATDVKTLKEFIDEYDSEVYGNVDEFNSSLCPCVLCMDEYGSQVQKKYEQTGESPSEEMV